MSTKTATSRPVTLRDLATASRITLGTSLAEWYFRGDQKPSLRLASENFNGVTAQGLYLLWNKPPQDRTGSDFALHDATAEWVRSQRMKTFVGLHLLWQKVGIDLAPDSWLVNVSSNDALLKLIVDHVEQLTKRYPEINYWSVVNEPFDSFWNSRFGNNHIWMETAFQVAHQSNPNAKLFLNDYGIEIPGSTTYNSDKRDQVLSLLTSLKQNGVPIDGIGFQMHVYGKDFVDENKATELMAQFSNNIKTFQNAGVEVYITELDVRMDGLENISKASRWEIQARAYKLIIQTALDAGVNTITIFGFWDPHSWFSLVYGIKDADALLFDENVDPKPAYYAIRDVLMKYAQK